MAEVKTINDLDIQDPQPKVIVDPNASAILNMGNVNNIRAVMNAIGKNGTDFMNWYDNTYKGPSYKFTTDYRDPQNIYNAFQQYQKEKNIKDFWGGRDMTKMSYVIPVNTFDQNMSEQQMQDLRKKVFTKGFLGIGRKRDKYGDQVAATAEAFVNNARQNGVDITGVTAKQAGMTDEDAMALHMLYGTDQLDKIDFSKKWVGDVTNINDEVGMQRANALINQKAAMDAFNQQFVLPVTTTEKKEVKSVKTTSKSSKKSSSSSSKKLKKTSSSKKSSSSSTKKQPYSDSRDKYRRRG